MNASYKNERSLSVYAAFFFFILSIISWVMYLEFTRIGSDPHTQLPIIEIPLENILY